MSNKPCKECGGPVDRSLRGANNKKFCSDKCRGKDTWRRVREVQIAKWREERGKYAEGKIQCRLCEKWYVKVASHAFLTHHLTEEQYKEYFDLPLSKGIITEEHRLLLREHALENGMDEQLKRVGVRTRYKKGDPKAVEVRGWKGRNGSKGYQEL